MSFLSNPFIFRFLAIFFTDFSSIFFLWNIGAYTFDFETPYIERTFKGLDFFKARNITINAKAGDAHFSLQWVFNFLASALDTILLVKICDKKQPLRICKHCGKLFIAENVRAEYDTPQCRNQANVYKSRERNK